MYLSHVHGPTCQVRYCRMFPYCPWAHLDEAPPVRLCLVLLFPVHDAGVRRRRPALAPSRLLPLAGGCASTFPRSADLVAPPRPGARAWPRRSPARAPPRLLAPPPTARAAADPFSPTCSRCRLPVLALLLASPGGKGRSRRCAPRPGSVAGCPRPGLPAAVLARTAAAWQHRLNSVAARPGGGGRCSRRAQAAPQIGGCTGRRCPNLRCARCAAFN